MTTSRTPAAIDALVDILTAAPALQNWAPYPVRVFDGPVYTQQQIQNALYIGMDDPDSEAAPIGAETEQQFAGLGTRQKNEEGTIHCVAECWDGSVETGALREKRHDAYAIVAAVEAIVRADATLGGVLPSGWCEVDNMQLRQDQSSEGAIARVSFEMKYKCRLDNG